VLWGVMLLLLLLKLVLFGTSSYESILFGKDTDDASSEFVVDDGLVVFPDDIDSEFLAKQI
jgi:hypothetical protein